MRHTRWLAGQLAAATLALAAGCGLTGCAGPPTVPEIASQVQTALRSISSVHVSGLMVSGTRRTRVDLNLTRAGGMYGTLSDSSGPLTVLAAGGTTYLLATLSSLKRMGLPVSACPVLCHRYFELTQQQDYHLLQSLGWTTFLGPSVGAQLHQVTMAGTAAVRGRPAWVLRAAAGGTAYVAARGTPYLLRVLPGNGLAGGQLDFSEWNRVVIPPVPPISSVIAQGGTSLPGPAAN